MQNSITTEHHRSCCRPHGHFTCRFYFQTENLDKFIMQISITIRHYRPCCRPQGHFTCRFQTETLKSHYPITSNPFILRWLYDEQVNSLRTRLRRFRHTKAARHSTVPGVCLCCSQIGISQRLVLFLPGSLFCSSDSLLLFPPLKANA